MSSLALGPTQPQTQQILGVLLPVLKWQGCESDQSPPSADDVKNKCNYTTTLPFVFVECTGEAFIGGKTCQWNMV